MGLILGYGFDDMFYTTLQSCFSLQPSVFRFRDMYELERCRGPLLLSQYILRKGPGEFPPTLLAWLFYTQAMAILGNHVYSC